jgi:hypothetical protein
MKTDLDRAAQLNRYCNMGLEPMIEELRAARATIEALREVQKGFQHQHVGTKCHLCDTKRNFKLALDIYDKVVEEKK